MWGIHEKIVGICRGVVKSPQGPIYEAEAVQLAGRLLPRAGVQWPKDGSLVLVVFDDNLEGAQKLRILW